MRRRYEPYGMYSDDDANSDASSACSERSYGSRNGGIPHYLRQTEDVAEVLNHCASSNWSERKEGLIGLQNLLKSQRTLRWVHSFLVSVIHEGWLQPEATLIYLPYGDRQCFHGCEGFVSTM